MPLVFSLPGAVLMLSVRFNALDTRQAMNNARLVGAFRINGSLVRMGP